jgi:hypothetical protein
MSGQAAQPGNVQENCAKRISPDIPDRQDMTGQMSGMSGKAKETDRPDRQDTTLWGVRVCPVVRLLDLRGQPGMEPTTRKDPGYHRYARK